jgi:GNAT superfamily N-acetyltransferase
MNHASRRNTGPRSEMMALKLFTIPAGELTAAQTDAVAAFCGWIFNCNYRYLMDLCPERTHVLGYEDDRLVAHALWLDRPLRVDGGPWLNTAYVEGVATHPDYRNRGNGGAVMRWLQEGDRLL